MNAPKFPEKAIVKILIEESKSSAYKPKLLGDEFREMFRVHIENMEKLETYEEINSWLCQYRRLTLQEWVESL